METEHDVVTIERHRVWIEEPYALVMRLEGDITGDNQNKMLAMVDLVGGGEGPVIIVQYLSKAGAYTGAARKALMDDARTVRVTAVICIDASFQMRVFLTMIGKAMKLFNREVRNTLFAKDESEARALLAVERERLRAKAEK